MARRPPIELTPEIQATICKAIAEGNTRETAAALAGINPRTFYRWMSKGRKSPEDTFGQLCQAVKKAEAKATAEAVKAIRTAGKKTWQAYAWWLERKYPEDWGSDKALIRELLKRTAEQDKRIDRLMEINSGRSAAKNEGEQQETAAEDQSPRPDSSARPEQLPEVPE